MNEPLDSTELVETGTLSASDVAAEARQGIDYLQLGLKYKWLLALGLFGGLTLGIAAYLKLGPAYEATARILVSKQVTVQIKDGETATYGERGEHIALIMSPMIVGKALKMHHLNQLPSLATSKEPVEDILDSLIVKRSAGHDQSFLNVIDIFYRNPNKQDAETIVAAIIDAYRSYLDETMQEHTGEVVQLITKANTDLLKQLREKEQEYLAFRESTPLQWKSPPGVQSTPANVTNVHQQSLEAIEAERRSDLLKRTELNSKIKSLDEAVASGQSRASLELLVRVFMSTGSRIGATTAQPTPGSAGPETQLLPLLTEEKRLLRDYGPDHPKVQSVRKSIETVRNFYRCRGVYIPDNLGDDVPSSDAGTNQATAPVDLVAVYRQSLQQQLSELDHREEELARLQEREAQLAKEFARYEAQDQTFNDEIAALKSLWDVVVRRLNEVNLVKTTQGYSVKQIAPVRVELLIKRILKFLAAGVFVGLGMVLLRIFLHEWQDTTLKTVDEIRRIVNRPVLGSVPRFAIDEMTQDDLNAASPLVAALCYYHRPASVEAEAYRSVRTTLLTHIGQTGERVIQVSSSEPADGKTTFVSNLALAMAQTGKKVLLIDADLRRPRIHTLFGIPQEIGLTDVLENEINFLNAVKTTVVPGLSILASGTSKANPAEQLSSVEFEKLISAARREFDVVLVDTPPLLVVSDSCTVAQQTDGLVLVVQVAKNRRVVVKRALERLETDNVNIIGVVANLVDRFSEDAYGYSADYGVYLDGETRETVPSADKTILAGSVK